MIIRYMYDPTLVDLTSKFFVLCTNIKVYLHNFYSGWSLACIFMKERVKYGLVFWNNITTIAIAILTHMRVQNQTKGESDVYEISSHQGRH